uniref:PHB domain-containing protein n=1 Tax=Macrostomum lignano TaxID=282301 RepID=A0A1I8ITG2_9PLAT
ARKPGRFGGGTGGRLSSPAQQGPDSRLPSPPVMSGGSTKAIPGDEDNEIIEHCDGEGASGGMAESFGAASTTPMKPGYDVIPPFDSVGSRLRSISSLLRTRNMSGQEPAHQSQHPQPHQLHEGPAVMGPMHVASVRQGGHFQDSHIVGMLGDRDKLPATGPLSEPAGQRARPAWESFAAEEKKSPLPLMLLSPPHVSQLLLLAGGRRQLGEAADDIAGAGSDAGASGFGGHTGCCAKCCTAVILSCGGPGGAQRGAKGIGVCGIVLLFLSYGLTIVTFPFSLCLCIKVVAEYERAVIFRLGRIVEGGAKGPGLFFVVPCMDVIRKVDLRTVTFDVPPQEVLTKDSVTVAVDAVVYYRIYNPVIAVTNVEDADRSTRLLAATTLRNVLGTKNLSEILSERESISAMMQETLDEATHPWGVKVERVEVKDVRLPVQLQRAMAAEAEAAREARAKVIAAEGEQKASRALKEAADVLNESPLRYLQTLNTISAEKNSTIIFPLPIEILSNFMHRPRLWSKVCLNHSGAANSRMRRCGPGTGSCRNSCSSPGRELCAASPAGPHRLAANVANVGRRQQEAVGAVVWQLDGQRIRDFERADRNSKIFLSEFSCSTNLFTAADSMAENGPAPRGRLSCPSRPTCEWCFVGLGIICMGQLYICMGQLYICMGQLYICMGQLYICMRQHQKIVVVEQRDNLWVHIRRFRPLEISCVRVFQCGGDDDCNAFVTLVFRPNSISHHIGHVQHGGRADPLPGVDAAVNPHLALLLVRLAFLDLLGGGE